MPYSIGSCICICACSLTLGFVGQCQAQFTNPAGTRGYMLPERFAATRPVSFTFPVHRDYATAYALHTDPRWGNSPQRLGVQPVSAYRPVTQMNRPVYGVPYSPYQVGYSAGANVAGGVPRSIAPYYPGASLFGSTKAYGYGEPVRNFFRYLAP